MAALLDTIERQRFAVIVGTDTGVGKTRVAALIATLLAERGAEVAAVKLLATGCTRSPSGAARNEDAAILHDASTDAGRAWMASQGIEPGCAVLGFEYPMAPVSSARRQGFRLHRQLVGRTAESLRGQAREAGILLLIEGIGGVRVPVSERDTWIDAVPPTKWGTVVVGRTALGAINHMLLTLGALSYPRIPVAAVVLSRSVAGVDPPVEQSTFAEIGHFLRPSTPFLLLDHGGGELLDLRGAAALPGRPRPAEIIEISSPGKTGPKEK